VITSILDWLGSGMKYLASFHKFFLDAIAIKDKFGIRVEGTKLNNLLVSERTRSSE
jgi:hypothetical protein